MNEKDGVYQYEVKWEGYPTSDNSWVDESELHHCDKLIEEFLTKQGRSKLYIEYLYLKVPKEIHKKAVEMKWMKMRTLMKAQQSEENHLTLRVSFTSTCLIEGNIYDSLYRNVPKIGDVHLICGGPPCKDYRFVQLFL
jgi:hypothetical protein